MTDPAPTAPTTTAPVSPTDPLPLAHGAGWANRLTLAPLTNKQSHADGTLSDHEHDWLVARARGGFGLVMTCAAYVAPAGQAWSGQLGVSSDAHLPGLTRLATSLREAGAASSVQLHHGGRRADPALTGRPNQCPWDDPDKDAVAMSTAEVQEAVADFVSAAVRAERAGFDGVEVHGAHGYLLCQFLDARHNRRDDRYGGSPENRRRMLMEVLAGIREATAPGFCLGVRLTPEGAGVELPDGVETARDVLASGLVDYVDMSLWDVHGSARTPGAQGLLIEHFTDLPRGETRLGVAGRILSAGDVAWCLEQGADFVSIGTAAIIHHDFAARVGADPAFVSTPQPVTRAHLAAESVGPDLIDYLATNWDDFVVD